MSGRLAELVRWFAHSQAAWHNLRASNQLLLIAAPAACLALFLSAFAMPAAELMAQFFGIEMDEPLRGQPGGYIIGLAYLAVLMFIFAVGHLVGCFLVSLWLHFARGYPWNKVVRIVLHAEYPAHWQRK
jgi:hypothetical protein